MPRAVLLSISHLSGERYERVSGEDLEADLERRGYPADHVALYNLLWELQAGGFVDCEFAGGMSVHLIRLGLAGRQEVEGWPTVPGMLSARDVEELVAVLEARSEDADVPDPERGKARAAAGALRDLGVSVTAEVITAWLKHVGVG